MRAATGLPRLVRLYQILERLRSRELVAASLATEEVSLTQQRMIEGRRLDQATARSRLADGSWVEASANLVGHQAAEAQLMTLAKLGLVRSEGQATARALHQVSLTELRQVETLLAAAEEATAELEERFSQAASDDRYLSRREWIRTRALRQRE